MRFGIKTKRASLERKKKRGNAMTTKNKKQSKTKSAVVSEL